MLALAVVLDLVFTYVAQLRVLWPARCGIRIDLRHLQVLPLNQYLFISLNGLFIIFNPFSLFITSP